jgi:ParB-like chromosome segregation protein Spo0J
MSRRKQSEETKRCRQDLRILALWRVMKGKRVKRVGLRNWLGGHVDIDWGAKGRPADLGTAKEEANSTIAHLLDHDNFQVTDDSGKETIRLVKPVQALEESVKRLREYEELASEKARKLLRDGDPVPVTEVFPAWLKDNIAAQVGERLWRALEQAVVEGLKRDPAYKFRTVKDESGQRVEQVRLTSPTEAPPANDNAVAAGEPNTSEAGLVGTDTEEQAAPGDKVAQRAYRQLQVVMLPVSQLYPNDWNPNVLTDEQKGELLEEVHRLGRPAKPIVVRRLHKHVYQIIDGENNWEAAKEDGQVNVPCEIVKVGDFEAMRQTFQRNQHGTRDPVRTGRMFHRMIELGGTALDGSEPSRRNIAREIGSSEATVRNYMLYGRAAEVRNGYAPETADDTISKLSVAKVRLYLELPEARRDEWLDRGGSSEEAVRILEEAGKKTKGTKGRVELKTVSPSPAGCEQGVKPADADPEETPEPAPAVGNGGDEVNAPREAREGEKPAEALSQEERAVVEGVLKSYREGRTLVRHKILAGLAAHPDAVTYFRRMIKNGS